MNSRGVAIRYGDVAPEAKENFYPSVNDKADFVNLSQLQQYNLNFPNYANPCELYSVVFEIDSLFSVGYSSTNNPKKLVMSKIA